MGGFGYLVAFGLGCWLCSALSRIDYLLHCVLVWFGRFVAGCWCLCCMYLFVGALGLGLYFTVLFCWFWCVVVCVCYKCLNFDLVFNSVVMVAFIVVCIASFALVLVRCACCLVDVGF